MNSQSNVHAQISAIGVAFGYQLETALVEYRMSLSREPATMPVAVQNGATRNPFVLAVAVDFEHLAGSVTGVEQDPRETCTCVRHPQLR